MIIPPTVIMPKIDPTDCQVALAYLAIHAAPGFAQFCRPGDACAEGKCAEAFTCVPGTPNLCPDGVKEIVIGLPSCPATYENEASNSFVLTGQSSASIDPYGSC